MKLHYYKDPNGNFGDDLNPWLWPKLLPDHMGAGAAADTLFLGIGTLLNEEVPESPRRKLVFGTGAGYGSPPSIGPEWHFFCVRGPLTARALGLPPSFAVTDAAILVREFVAPASGKPSNAAFMPHHRSAEWGDWESVCARARMTYIDPAAPVEDTLDKIRSSRLLITEAMHGAIVADALRVPWIPVRTNPGVLEFKWRDWTASLDLEHEFHALPLLDRAASSRLRARARICAKEVAIALRLRWLTRFARPLLSSDKVLDRVYSEKLERLEALRAWKKERPAG